MTVAEIAQRTDDELLAHCIAGLEAQGTGQMHDAVSHFVAALSVAPTSLDVRLLLAYAQGAAGDRTGAHGTLAETPHLDVLNEADARRICDAATSLGAWATARIAVEQLLVITPRDADLHATLGALHHRLDDLASASLVLHRAHTRWPTHVPTLMNRARLLSETGEQADALALYDEVLRHAPTHTGARWYRGLVNLLLGRMMEGWHDHEARRVLPFMQTVTPAGIPAWDGGDIADKSVLLWGEQGLGDQIMGARFATLLAARGARVVVRCAPSLVSVVGTVEGVSVALASGDNMPLCDLHVPMLSVPHLLRTPEDVASAGHAYMHAPGDPSTRVRRVLRAEHSQTKRRTRVGVAWAGSATHGNDHNRSMPTTHLAALLDGADVDWVSLQMGNRRDDLASFDASLRARITDASVAIDSFGDTAHVLRSCDMVVTVDTAVAHLAGALGISTIVMLPYVPDWRWQVARRDTPWYRTVRLIRQPMAGAWEYVIGEVHRAINSGSA